jgi:hypothetical protein
MTGSRTKCLTAPGPIGGGLVKLGRGSTVAAVAVGLAPYAIWVLLVAVFVIGYIAALTRFLWAKPEEQDAMERLIMISANAVVSILTLSLATPLVPAKRNGHSRRCCTRYGKAWAASSAQPSANLLPASKRPAVTDLTSSPRGRAS